jgi:hypothetical protein
MDTHVVIDHLGTTKGRGAATAAPLDGAAWAPGINRVTVRRGLRGGGLTGEQAGGSPGLMWYVHLPGQAVPPPVPVPPELETHAAAPAAELMAAWEAVRRLEAHVDDLRRQLEDRAREAAQLHTLLAQAHRLAPPSGEEPPNAPPAGGRAGRSWWRRLWGVG